MTRSTSAAAFCSGVGAHVMDAHARRPHARQSLQGVRGFGGVSPVAAGLIMWHRVDEPDPLVIPQRWFPEPGVAGDLPDGQPNC